jgi:hypothetical protein
MQLKRKERLVSFGKHGGNAGRRNDMADGSPPETTEFTAIPLAQIAETRRSFPNRALSYEALFTVEGLQAVAALADACATAGLAMGTMRCGPNGAHCVLHDAGNADLGALAEVLVTARGLRLDRWTTVVQF